MGSREHAWKGQLLPAVASQEGSAPALKMRAGSALFQVLFWGRMDPPGVFATRALAVDDVAVPPAQGSSSTSEVRPGSLIPALLLLPGPAVSPGQFPISGLGFSPLAALFTGE